MVLQAKSRLQNDVLSRAEIQCHECALTVKLPSLVENQKAHCPRCGFTLTVVHKNAIERIIAFSIAALIFLVASLPFEFLSFKSNGLENKFSITSSFNILINDGYHVLAFIEFVTIFAIPCAILTLLLYVLIPLNRMKVVPHAQTVLNFVYKLLPWSMVEIFFIGALVSLIKIISMADIELGLSFFAFMLFSLSMTIAVLHIDKKQLSIRVLQSMNSALTDGTVSINKSSSRIISVENNTHKNTLSIQKTWAYIITAIVLYIPANTLPIMTTSVLGQDEPSTIMGGVFLLWNTGSYPIAAIIFFASVVVPTAKILVLAWLNYSVQKQSNKFNTERITLYRIAEFVGRWSMVDVFVVIVLASLIQLGQTMSIAPGTASLAFSGVVVITMLAAMSFEPQLIWKTSKHDN